MYDRINGEFSGLLLVHPDNEALSKSRLLTEIPEALALNLSLVVQVYCRSQSAKAHTSRYPGCKYQT